MEALELAKEIARALDSKKGRDIQILKVEDLTVLADYFVIASGSSNTQVGALADEVEDRLTKLGVEPQKVEGRQSRSWVLLDYGTVIAHVFYPETRDFYALERLWADARPIEVEFGETQAETV